ncbi:CHRD domain-containing protein [Pseudonocardia sp. CA-107938]|uniref:CHRD domain-containing protein n=1 Tax=Pseudonocardia sp. CA-107938 TaxID=3240021 RepID=UPI003D8A90F7
MFRASLHRTALCLAAVAVLPVWAGPAAAAPPTDVSVPEPTTFTSTLTSTATPDQVVDDFGKPMPGQPGASGTFTLRINSQQDIVCYDITLTGVTQPYESSARTATHLQEGKPGESGYPRMVFPDPQGPPGGPLTSKGCLKGPFTTGVVLARGDTGRGFRLAMVESNPADWFVDVHTKQFRVGAVRGQLVKAG